MTTRAHAEKTPITRVGDRERDECSALLIDHHLHGRLSAEELDVRQTAALHAITSADLQALLADMPVAAARGKRTGISWPALSPRLSAIAVPLAGPAAIATVAYVQYTADWWQETTNHFEAGLVMGAFGYGVHWLMARWRR